MRTKKALLWAPSEIGKSEVSELCEFLFIAYININIFSQVVVCRTAFVPRFFVSRLCLHNAKKCLVILKDVRGEVPLLVDVTGVVPVGEVFKVAVGFCHV